MKKITSISLIISALLLFNNTISAQAFQKGNKNIDIGLGLGLYGTTVSDNQSSKSDGAASFIMPIGFEYGISDKFGLGFQLGFVSYFINRDSNETLESVKSVDFAIKANYHLLNSDRNDLFIGIGLGGSSVKWKDSGGASLSGSGAYFSLSISDRIFFGEHVGILFNLGYTMYNYGSIEYSDSSGNTNTSDKLSWKLNGVNFGTGLAIKF